MSAPHHYTTAVHSDRRDWHNVRALLPYLWEYRGRVLFALACLVLAKAANVGVPLVLKGIVDELDASLRPEVTLPVAFLLAYGALRLAASAFNELRDTLFARVRYHAVRRLSVRTVEHLHALSLRFHLERKTGAISRDLQRAAGSLATLLNYMVFSILPVLVELGLVLLVLLGRYKPVFTLVVLASMAAYIAFTVAVSNWRMEHRQTMNRLESEANNEAMDGLINYETVKYFGNERLESGRYDRTLAEWEDTAVLSTHSMSLLNFGQGAIIALGVTAILFFAAAEVKNGEMTLGDLVLVNAMLLQLFIPLGFLGIVYRQIKYALVDMDHLVKLFEERPEIRERADARPLEVAHGEVRFEHVDFHYAADRPILHDVDFVIPPGKKVAVVGASGAGKSTLVRLLFRFYDVSGGRITIDGQDIREVTQDSLRGVIGIVPQDTVLFNDTLLYNLQYARPDASIEDIHAAARLAHIHDFIMSLPQGYDTRVGERGLKLSGGEKQRVAIARAVLKRPRILVFDEATSALDTQSEQGILQALREAAARHTA
ncbi:MAG: ABC transporter ATP-binding protein/permease, partial [Ectothiorhodospiraceae bacterium]|nr:ABC transporter ATP-binding protein/permease [Ectothiorhodospiraceae bacterium]